MSFDELEGMAVNIDEAELGVLIPFSETEVDIVNPFSTELESLSVVWTEVEVDI
jgi:hypothetical protein